VDPPEAGTFTGTDTVSLLAVSDIFAGSMYVRVQALNGCGSSSYSDSLLVNVHPLPTQFNMVPDGGYCAGGEGFEILLDGSQTAANYELFRNDTTTGIILPGTGEPLNFGYQSTLGIYTITVHSFTCSIAMNDSTNVYLLPAVETAAAPSGSTEECNSNTGTEYTTPGAVNATYYIWQLIPAEAGVVSGSTTVGTVDWSPAFSGPVSVKVQGADDCGPGPISDGFDVTIFDCTGIREQQVNKVFIYPNPVGNELTLNCNLGETGNAQLMIYNSYGQEVIRKEIHTGNGEVITTFSTEGFAAGAYSVKLISPSGKLFEGKFLKMK
jgi:hypothetical protein